MTTRYVVIARKNGSKHILADYPHAWLIDAIAKSEWAKQNGYRKVQIVEIPDYKPTGTTADDKHVADVLESMGY